MRSRAQPQPEVAVSFRDVYVIFGDDVQQTGLQMARNGSTHEEILNATGAIAALSGITFDVHAGELFCVMGLSGSGKSSLVRCVNRLITPSHGSVFVNGADVTEMSQSELKEARRRQFAMVFQGYGLMPHRTVLENAAWGLRLNEVDKEERRARAWEALKNVGLERWADAYPSGLSGGMKQRVGIARALAMDTPIILMDEPFSEIDPIFRRTLQNDLLELHRSREKTIIFITHNTNEAIKLADRMAVIRDGKVIQIDEPHYLASHPVDDYVREFILEVHEEYQVTAASIMNRRVLMVREDVMAGVVQRLMRERGTQHALVVNVEGSYVGTATAASIEAALGLADVPVTDTALVLEPTVTSGTDLPTMERRAKLAIASLPVVGPAGGLAGEISLEKLAEVAREF